MSSDRTDLFDAWAPRYDADVQRRRFPFGEYEQVLSVVLEQLELTSGARVLELGAGSGRLTERLAAAGAAVTAVDVSDRMIGLARRRAPMARFVRADLTDPAWADGVEGLDEVRFVTGTFVLHELPPSRQVELLRALADRLPDLRRIVVGDVGFPDAARWEAGRARWASLWDPAEHYWRGDELVAALTSVGFRAAYHQIGDHNGVLTSSPRA